MKKRMIKKRDDSLEPFSAEKLLKAISRLTKHLKVKDDLSIVIPILQNIDLKIANKDEITSKDLDKEILHSITELITDNPIFDTLASRQLRKMIDKEVRLNLGDLKFSLAIRRGVEENIYSDRLLNFDLNVIDDYLANDDNYKFDNLSYMGVTTLADRYLVKSRNGIWIENPQFFFMRVALGIADSHAQALDIYNSISNLEYLHSTPTLFNSGLIHSQLSSCFVTVTDDSLESIMDKTNEHAHLAKYAGGIGDDITRLRASGSYIKSLNAKSSGPIPFLKIRDSLTLAIQQGGKRRSSLVEYIQPWHYNTKEFLELKEKNIDPTIRLDNLNTAFWMPDEMMRRIKHGEDLYFFDPAECPELVETHGSDFTEKYNKCIAKALNCELKLYRVENGKTWFNYYMSKLAKTGHPWLTFKDRHNESNPVEEYGVINSSNLCVTGDTYLHTAEGLITAEKLYTKGLNGDCRLNVAYDKRVDGDSSAQGVELAATIGMKCTATNVPVFEVITEDGFSVRATEWHDFYMYTDESLMEIKKVPLNKLTKGDILLLQTSKGFFGKNGNNEAYKRGFNIGKSVLVDVEFETLGKKGRPIISSPEDGIFEGTEQFVKGYLTGVISTAATVEDEKLIFSELLTPLNKKLQLLFINFGIKASINNEGKLEIKEEQLLRLILEFRIYEDLYKNLHEKYNHLLAVPNTSRIKEIKFSHIADKVYDTTQLKNHSLIFNGIVTGNCTEISLPNSEDRTAVCTLASINIAKHVKSRRIDEDKLRKTVRTAVTALDSILDKNFYPSDESKKHTMELRPLGLGVMGFAEALLKLGVPYDSDKAVQLAKELGEIIKDEAYKTSELLAEAKGPFPFYNKLKNPSFKPRRNSHLLAIAPTASIGIIANTSSSIESYYSNIFARDTLSGKFIQVNKYLYEMLDKYELWNKNILNKIKEHQGRVTKIEEIKSALGEKINLFKTAFEIPVERQIDIAAAFQPSIDQAISRNLYINSERRSPDEMASIYLYAWEAGLKSTYYCHIERTIKTEKYTSNVNKTGGALKLGDVLKKSTPTTDIEGCPIDPAERASCESCQ